MKNFIWIINKEKIYAYILSVVTVVTLFVMSTMINRNLDESELTSTNIVENIQYVDNEANTENENTDNSETDTTINALVDND